MKFEKIERRERADCTVCALSAAKGIPYESAYQELSKQGRKPRATFHWREAAESLGFEAMPELSLCRVKSVLPEISSGRYVVRVSGHVFAVVDGVVLDGSPPNPNQIAQMIYRLVV